MKIKKWLMGQSLTHLFLYVRPGFFHPQWLIVLLQSTCPYVTSVGATQMKPGSTVDDPEMAAMVDLTGGTGPFFSGGGFSNVFPSVILLSIWYYESDTDKINNSGYLNTRDMPLNIIRGDIWNLLLLRLVNITTLEMWEFFFYLLPLHPDKLPFRPVLTPIFQQMGALFFLNLCQITDPDMVVLKGFLRCWLVYSKKDYSKYWWPIS